MTPQVIQLRRTKGWRKPEGVIVVARPSRYGNMFTVASCVENGFALDVPHARVVCVEAFRSVLMLGSGSPWFSAHSADRVRWILDHLHELRGHDLACWCPQPGPCHAHVLIDLANRAKP